MTYTPIDTKIAVPTQNSAANTSERDVIGNKTDDESGNSIMARLYILEKHEHSQSKVYPTLANATVVTKVSNAAWGVDANTTQIIPASTITNPFDIHYINFGSLSAADEFELILFKGGVGAEVEIARMPFDRSATQTEGSLPCQTELLPANTRISAKLSSGSANSRNVSLKLHYHEY